MRILTAELRKTLTKRFFAILLVALLANFLLFRHNLSRGYNVYSMEEYLTAQQEISAMDPEERVQFITDRNRMLEACRKWERYDLTVEMGGTGKVDDEMLLYQEVYESGGYLRYCEYLYSEQRLISYFASEISRIEGHGELIQRIIAEAKLKTTVSIYAKPGTFAHSSQLATIERFEKLADIVPEYDPAEGIVNMQQSAVTDLIALLMILLLCTELVVTEQKNGMLPILRATRKGRFPLIAAKITVTFVLSFMVSLVLWGSNLCYSAAVFGLGDLSRPVQSLSGFAATSMAVSVGEYLGIFFASKWLLYALVGLMCLLAGLIWRGAMPTWLTVGGFLGVEYILSKSITAISAWNILKYVNVSNLIFEIDWLQSYRNLNFFRQPVEVLTASWVLLAALLVAVSVMLCLFFCRRKVRTLPRLRIPLRRPKWLPTLGRSTKLLGHESWKLLIECGVALVLVLLFLLNWKDPWQIAYSSEELYYKNYMEILAGPWDEEKQIYLDKEEQRFADLEAQIDQINQELASGQISSADASTLTGPLERALKARDVLQQRVYPQIQRVQEAAKEGKELWLVYEPGYEYLFGANDRNDKTGAAAMAVAAVILCFANFYPMETTTGMLPLLNVYRRGRKATARTKLILSAVCAMVIFAVVQIPDYRYVMTNYSFDMLNAPMASLQIFSGWPGGISILWGLIIFEAVRLLSLMAVLMVVLLVSLWTKNQLTTLAVNVGILLFPLLLHLLELDFLDAISFQRSLTGSVLFTAKAPLPGMLAYYGITFAIGGVCIWQILRFVNGGYRYRKLHKK